MPRGGKRIGAGRKRGSTSKRDTAGVRLSLVAQEHTAEAIQALLDVMKNGKSEGARASAACAVLDRGYGRPATQVEFVEPDEPVSYRTVAEIKQEMIDRGFSPEYFRLMADDLEKYLTAQNLEGPASNHLFFSPK
jgi:hypothetical protein